jgi:hypothetical protein
MASLSLIDAQKTYLLRCRLPSGTFRLSPDSSVINPYFTNLALLTLVQLGEHEAVKHHLTWYLGHVAPDGTIHDYRLAGSREIDTGKADSEDSYHATFFSLLAAFVKASGQTDWLVSRGSQLRILLDALLRLQQNDGRTWAKRTWKVKYLMDNCEVYQGLTDAAFLFREMGDHESAELARKRAADCLNGIEATYDPARSSFAVMDREYPRWSKWYPDATSQAFPALYGIIPAASATAKLLYQQFTSHFPHFDTFRTGDLYPWMMIGEYARLMGDIERTKRMLTAAEELYIWGPRRKYWLLHEASRFVALSLHVHG